MALNVDGVITGLNPEIPEKLLPGGRGLRGSPLGWIPQQAQHFRQERMGKERL